MIPVRTSPLPAVASPGAFVERVRPHKIRRVISPTVAQELTQMMVSVVTGGTATNLQTSGLQLAGKTGTAETNVNGKYDSWFIAFAPADAPRIAVAVVLEHQENGFGGAVAAPIAKQVIETYLRK